MTLKYWLFAWHRVYWYRIRNPWLNILIFGNIILTMWNCPWICWLLYSTSTIVIIIITVVIYDNSRIRNTIRIIAIYYKLHLYAVGRSCTTGHSFFNKNLKNINRITSHAVMLLGMYILHSKQIKIPTKITLSWHAYKANHVFIKRSIIQWFQLNSW